MAGDGDGVIGVERSVGDGDAASLGKGLSCGRSVGLGLVSAWPTTIGLCRDRR